MKVRRSSIGGPRGKISNLGARSGPTSFPVDPTFSLNLFPDAHYRVKLSLSFRSQKVDRQLLYLRCLGFPFLF